ncbi:hypothetical protein MASR1M66_21340 [Aminivibrio sp.]
MDARTQGLLSMLASTVFFSATSTLIRLAPGIDPFKTSLFRFAIGLTLPGTAAMGQRIRLVSTTRPCSSAAARREDLRLPLPGPSTPSAWARGPSTGYTYPVFAAIWGVLCSASASRRAPGASSCCPFGVR